MRGGWRLPCALVAAGALGEGARQQDVVLKGQSKIAARLESSQGCWASQR